jgi:UPF0755 protein
VTDSDHLGIGLDYDEPHPRRSRRRRRPSVLGRLVLLLVVLAVLIGIPTVLFIGGSSLLHRLGSSPPADYAGSGSGSVVVQVHPGDSLAKVGATLEHAGVVKSVGAFTDAAAGDETATSLQPGFYRLHKRMSGAAALTLLESKGSRVASSVTVPEGDTLAQAVRIIAARTPLRVRALEAAVKSPKALPAYARGRAEGFLYPATYAFDPGTTARSAIDQLVQQFDKHATELGLVAGAQALGRTPYDVVTVASILEKEAGVSSDFPKVARVVYNRLAKGMPLQLDSTLNYVLTQRKGHLTIQDLQNPSAYNTYRHTGLPPTPIGNPGSAALAAALHPAQGDWLYFVTIDKQGHSAFTSSYSQFLRLKAQAKRNGVIG